MILLQQVAPHRYWTCVGDTVPTLEETNTWLTRQDLLGFRIFSGQSGSAHSSAATCNVTGQKIIIIQSSIPASPRFFHPIKLHNLYYNHFYYEDPINAVFQKHVCQQIYQYLIELPFITFFHLQHFIASDEDFVGWKFPKKLQDAFNLQLCVSPFFQNFFNLNPSQAEDIYLSANELQHNLQQQHRFPTSTTFDHDQWLCFKHNPLQNSMFPFLMIHAGTLIMPNFIPAHPQAENYFKSSVVGTLQMNQGHFDIPFNPAIYIRHIDCLFVKQRFFVYDRVGRQVRFDPNSSHVWFEINFY